MSTETNARVVTKGLDVDIDAVLSPSEAEGTYRDSRECAALALAAGAGAVLLSPPTPRPRRADGRRRMEQSGTSPRLAGVVHDLASEVVSVLRDGGHSSVVGGTVGTLADDRLSLAAVRVLGADVLLPSVLT
ncbi:hypothetical protein SSPS47_12310 [Streptomyces sp. S4.7]|nr:hypothetical protein SSPS47_12310 [Streptomyces sp. S4.7]